MKIEKYIIRQTPRSQINLADYNPRKISEDNRRKVKANIKKYGMLQPIIVNKTTGNVVAGNQRLSIMDELNRDKDYTVTIAEINVSKEDEVKLNIFLNNHSAAGEYDVNILHDIFEKFPKIDPLKDAGFDKVDLNFMFDGIEFEKSMFFNTESHAKVKSDLDKIAHSNKLKEYKKRVREKNKAGESGIEDIQSEDNIIIFVFNSNQGKREFCRRIKVKESEKFLSYKKLFDILDERYK